MNVVGRVGSLISQGVYSVATPFHPFGGAVDIIVVEQQDGAYRSTPWYVRFGKFQGVLKGAEKIVGISVNGVEANFHMNLDNSGEAYFVREVESGSTETESSSHIRDDLSSNNANQPALVLDENFSKSSDHKDNDECNGQAENNEGPYEFCDKKQTLDASIESASFASYHYGSLDEVEDMVESSQDSNSEMVLVSVDGHVLTAPISSTVDNTENLQLSTPQFHLGPGESSGGEDFGSVGDGWVASPLDDFDSSSPNYRETSGSLQETLSIEQFTMEQSTEKLGASFSRKDTFLSCVEFSDLTNDEEDSDSQCLGSPNALDSKKFSALVDSHSIITEGNQREKEADYIFQDSECASLSGSVPIARKIEEDEGEAVVKNLTECICRHVSLNMESDGRQLGSPPPCSDSQLSDGSPTTQIELGSGDKVDEDIDKEQNHVSVPVSFDSLKTNMELEDELARNSSLRTSTKEGTDELETSESQSQMIMSVLGFEVSLCGNLLHPGMGNIPAAEAFQAHRISKEEFESSGPLIVKDEKLIVRFKGKYFSWDKAAPVVLGMAVFGRNISVELKDPIPVEQDTPQVSKDASMYSTPSRGWRLWPIPFRRVRSFQPNRNNSTNVKALVDSESLQSPQKESPASCSSPDFQSPRKQFMRTNVPTTEQIASLNLKDGQNMITFSFCTRVLGKQQVDAHIYLWKWNARIVISDVDGTITKSDVLGQFMPLVGKDWSQSGVARLFSAIKENGYQLLFLSARAIVQAYLTRSFLRNLKQDGKALPNGPIVISPDGLFPSLYREVIRRAPHEFKIACLEDIKALFPSDYNPFYAGFGNRDTDELSYRKIGIPKGKIFIINPKGEVAINHSIDVKSYTSLHTLVNDMFPPTSRVEQEDYNSWNYWRVPLPSIDW